MAFATRARPGALAALRDAAPVPFWLDRPDRPAAAPALSGRDEADLVVVGAGFCGLWTALLAKQSDPGRDVVVLESGESGGAASGRNGGFCSSSLTHGHANGQARFPDEIRRLVALGRENLDGLVATVAAHGIDCSLERTGTLHVATETHQVAEIADSVRLADDLGEPAMLLDGEQTRARVASPLFVGAGLTPSTVMVDPARLAWGLRRVCLERGVRLYEHTPARTLVRAGAGIDVVTPFGAVRGARIALATNAFPPLLRRIRRRVVPVYDYALTTEPLTASQRAAVAWTGREGVSDHGNQFHYLRLTDDDRILFGGYDAIYYAGNGFGAEREHRPETYALLAEHFAQMFPQLEGIRFTHCWGGAIDTCARFSAFWGTALAGRVAYSVGYTGLGVSATRFGAAVMLDLLDGATTERTALTMVRRKPLPFPPEPLRTAVIRQTQRSMAAADRRQGERDLWLRTLDRIGLGFTS